MNGLGPFGNTMTSYLYCGIVPYDPDKLWPDGVEDTDSEVKR